MRWQMILCSLLGLLYIGADASSYGLENTHKEPSDAIHRIITIAPSCWEVLEHKKGVLPQGHYWGLDYEGDRGVLVVLKGCRKVPVRWKSSGKQWKDEYIAIETLSVWIMPGSYEQSWISFLVPHKPRSAELIFTDNELKLYALAGHRVSEEGRFDEVVSQATDIRWPNSPENDGELSWPAWKEELRSKFRGTNGQ